MQTLKPVLKLANAVVLGTLIYANASVSLPDAIAKHHYDFLAITLFIVVALCTTAFATGWLLSRIFAVRMSEKASLMFGMGMNNNGTGLVLAAMAMADHPAVLLPIIMYNLGSTSCGGRCRSICESRITPHGGDGSSSHASPNLKTDNYNPQEGKEKS